MDSRQPTQDRNTRLLAATLLLALAWSGSALARTQPVSDCADVSRLQSLDVPARALAATAVDHVPVIAEASELADDADTTDDMPTPLISLTPVAESALREIFEENPKPPVPATPSSPLAETEELPDISELPDSPAPEVAGEEDIDLPMLQRRMFRTDI